MSPFDGALLFAEARVQSKLEALAGEAKEQHSRAAAEQAGCERWVGGLRGGWVVRTPRDVSSSTGNSHRVTRFFLLSRSSLQLVLELKPVASRNSNRISANWFSSTSSRFQSGKRPPDPIFWIANSWPTSFQVRGVAPYGFCFWIERGVCLEHFFISTQWTPFSEKTTRQQQPL